MDNEPPPTSAFGADFMQVMTDEETPMPPVGMLADAMIGYVKLHLLAQHLHNPYPYNGYMPIYFRPIGRVTAPIAEALHIVCLELVKAGCDVYIPAGQHGPNARQIWYRVGQDNVPGVIGAPDVSFIGGMRVYHHPAPDPVPQ